MNKLLSLSVVVSLSACASAKPIDELKTSYTKYVNAIKTKNMEALGKLMTADFRNIEGHSATNKADTLEHMKTALENIQYESLTFEIKKVTARDKATVVLVRLTGTMNGKAISGGTSKYKLVQDCEDIWTKSAAGWMIKSSQTVMQQAYKDGKPLRTRH